MLPHCPQKKKCLFCSNPSLPEVHWLHQQELLKCLLVGAIDWTFVFPHKQIHKFICWNLNPSVIVLGGEALERWLDHKGEALMNAIPAFIMETPESHFAPSTTWGHSGKITIYEPGSGSYQTGICQHLVLELSLQNCDKEISVVLKYPVDGILL